MRVRSLGWEDPVEYKMATHSSILGKFHGQRSVAGYSPWGLKKLDTTEHTHTYTHTHTPTSRGGASLKSGTLFAFTLGSSVN